MVHLKIRIIFLTKFSHGANMTQTRYDISNFNYYDYGTKNTEYFQYQYFNELGFKISYLPFQKLNKIELGISFSNTAGYLEYNQISTKVVAIFEPFKNIYFDISYENRYRDSDYGNNQYLFSKLTYKF